MNLLTDTERQELDETWHQFKESLDFHDRSVALAYAKQHIGHIYITIRKLQDGKFDAVKVKTELKKALDKL